ncbi:MAG TPA: hypothetical protein VJJ98_08050 [Sedimentisphaerales bacterium]|nr:hypothetical protein [Sedimentisphaerales bacterium]
MDNHETEKTPVVAPKSFLAVGPTLHYSHSNVQRCWILAVCAFCVSCLFWSKIVTGTFWSFDIESVASPDYWRLGGNLVTGVSIFEYPWQIFVLGLLMGILTVAPVLISQLMSFGHSLLFVLAIILLADLPGFALCVLISCFGAACRPLRFRSRYIAIALCMTPQVIYWVFFGGARSEDPIEWGFSFTPWICAWLDGLVIAAFVLGIGHYTRYRPGLVWIFTLVTLVVAVGAFDITIGFDELDYQLYVAGNDPENVEEFHDHSVTEALDKAVMNPNIKRLFYVDDPIHLREDLKKEIHIQLGSGQWPDWFTLPKELDNQQKRQAILNQLDYFITRRPDSRRMPIALYFKALLKEYAPDVIVLEQKEILHFYSDYPHRDALLIWYRLHEHFSNSPESIEARWRIARDSAGRERFEQADTLLAEAEDMIAKRLAKLASRKPPDSKLLGLFRPPANSVMTVFRLTELQRRASQLRLLIGPQNRTDDPGSIERLARFVRLNPHALDYAGRLDGLLEQTEEKDPLRDNILLAQAKLVEDDQVQAERLNQLHQAFENTDGGMMALYELGRLKIGLYQNEPDAEQKKKHLANARATLSKFLELYPNSFCSEQVKEVLGGLPASEAP